MKNNKKYPAAIILCILYALLMFQEVVLHQVLCYKPNGTVDLELAFFDSKCECGHDELCHDPAPTSTFPGEAAIECCNDGCFDLLLNSAWLERIPGNSTHSTAKLISYYDIAVIHSISVDEPLKLLPETVPISKFLHTPPSPIDGVILRC